jgi:hypothetical protein
MLTIGSRAQVWHNNADHTSGGLTKNDLVMNKRGRIVSSKKRKTAKKEKRLEKAGFFTKKGVFGIVGLTKRRNNKRSMKMRKRLTGGTLTMQCKNRALLYLLAQIFVTLGKTSSNNSLISSTGIDDYFNREEGAVYGKFGKDVEQAVVNHVLVKKVFKNMGELTLYLQTESKTIVGYANNETDCNLSDLTKLIVRPATPQRTGTLRRPVTPQPFAVTDVQNYLELVKKLAIMIPIETVKEDADLFEIITAIQKEHNVQTENLPSPNA